MTSAVCYLTKLRSFLISKLLGIMDLRIGTVKWISSVGMKSQCFVNESSFMDVEQKLYNKKL